MADKLKASLRKNLLTEYSNDYIAQVLEKGSMDMENIIDELLNDGYEINRQMALDLLTKFNNKVSKMVLSGFNVNTGLINMHPVIKGTLKNGKWNSGNNSVSISINESFDLRQAITETKVEVVNENGETIILNDLKEKTLLKGFKAESNGSNSENSACGTAFRRWLMESPKKTT